jgi:hypothetical protein
MSIQTSTSTDTFHTLSVIVEGMLDAYTSDNRAERLARLEAGVLGEHGPVAGLHAWNHAAGIALGLIVARES